MYVVLKDGGHVVVDEGDDDESEGMGHEDEGDSERSQSPEGVLDEDEDIEDEDEDDEGEEGSADMELDNGDDWDDEDSREYAEALDRIEGEVRVKLVKGGVWDNGKALAGHLFEKLFHPMSVCSGIVLYGLSLDAYPFELVLLSELCSSMCWCQAHHRLP